MAGGDPTIARAHTPSTGEGAALSPEHATAALRAAVCDAPREFAFAWADGARGGVAERLVVDAATLTAELRTRILAPFPKGHGPVMVPALIDPARTRVVRDAVVSVTLVVIDHDAGTCPLSEALAALESVGLGAWGYPSPSAPLGPPERARRWRLLVPLAEGTAPDLYARCAPALRRAFESLIGAPLDGGTWRPETLCYVAPRPEVGGRAPSDVLIANGGALDIGALADAAATSGWWTPREARAAIDARRAGVRDGAALVALLDGAGLVLGAPDRRGWAPLRCPRERWHSGRAATRRDTSTVVHTITGACVCAHDHSAAPAEHRGPARTSRVLAWLREDHPELSPALALARDAGRLGDVRDALTRQPSGETPRRVVHLAAVEEEVSDALARALRRECLVLHTPTVGAGKSRAVGAAVVRVLRDGELHPDPEAQRPLASCGVAVRDRAAIADVAAAILRASNTEGRPVAVRVYTPVHEVPSPAASGRECPYHVAAERLYRRGASARASLCSAVPTPTGPRPCERRAVCLARDPWVLWVLGADGAGRPTTADATPLGAPWVAVVPHASALALGGVLRGGAVVVIDEADDALRPTVAELGGAELRHALPWVAALAPVRVEGRRPGDCHAPREVSRALVVAALASGVEALASVAPEARAPWCAAALAPLLTNRKVYGGLLQWIDAPDDISREALTEAVVRRWCSANIMGVRGDLRALTSEGVAALRALQRWASGCYARSITDDSDDDAEPRLSLAWRTDAAELCARVIDRRGGVLALDATGSLNIARAAITDAPLCRLAYHDPVRVDGGADVHRVVVHTSRGGRRALTPRGGVQWDAAADVLRAAVGVLRAGHREGHGRGEGLVFAARPLAVVCETLATVATDATDAAVCEALAAHRAWPSLSARARERITAAALAAPPEARRAVAELRAAGLDDVRWTWYGSTEARGSNAHRTRAWCVTLGDARTSLESGRSALWAMTGTTPTDTELRAAIDAAAAKAHTQAHGRLRALQREGAKLLAVHVGAVVPEDWHALPTAPAVVTPAGAVAWGSMPATTTRETPRPEADTVAEAAADVGVPVADTAHHDVRAAAAAGWTLAELQRATGRDRATVRAWWRGERAPRSRDDRAAVRALAAGETTPTLRAILCRLTSGRGWQRLWAGYGGVSGLAKRLEDLGVSTRQSAVHRWAESPEATLPVDVIGAIARVVPELVRVFPPVAELPAVARPLVVVTEARPGPVAARPTPRPVFGPVRVTRATTEATPRVASGDGARSSAPTTPRPPERPRPPPRGP